MLVLSRRPGEKILFPHLGVTVQVLGVQGGVVRIGIDAPEDVTILREELAGTAEGRHALLNRLNNLGLSLHLLRRQVEAGMDAEAFSTLEKAMPIFEEMERELSARRQARKALQQRRSALVVDDDANERELLAGLLEMNGLHCTTAPDGVTALDYLASHEHPDFVLLDLWMPNCDGAQTLRQIRGNPQLRDLTVFAVSGTEPNAAGLEVGPNGLNGWFPKPLNPSHLWEAIQREYASAQRTN